MFFSLIILTANHSPNLVLSPSSSLALISALILSCWAIKLAFLPELCLPL